MSRHWKHHNHWSKKQYRWTNFKRGIIRLSLNLAILAGFGGLLRYGYLLFTQKVDSLMGSILFILSIAVWILLIIFLRRRYRRTMPSFKLTAFSVVVILLIFTFAGVQPMALCKDSLIDNYRAAEAERATREAAEKEAAEAGRVKQEAVEEVAKVEQIARKTESLEREVVELANAIRVARGSSPLIWDNELYSYSKKHSENMASQGRLFHTPIGASYGENCWGGEGSTSWAAQDIVEGWMTSPPHRTWLLCPHLQHIAVGIAVSDRGMYASWTFWISEAWDSDWWYQYNLPPPDWWY